MVKAAEKSELALLGGPKAVSSEATEIFDWPIVTEEDEQAVLAVLRSRSMSGRDVSMAFEKEFAEWLGMKYAITTPNGTSALEEAMFAAGIGVGDEVIVASLTFWASIAQVYRLGGTMVFAEINTETLNIAPRDIEHRITERTKAIMPVHYAGYPCDMDAIMEIAGRHKLRVIEDVSHAQGSLYKGRKVGTFGDVSAMSLMSMKSFAIGEGGILVTNDRAIYERAIMYGHYARHQQPGIITEEEFMPLKGLPWGGCKNRLNQTASAMARVQLKHYPQRIGEIDKAMSYFCDQFEDVEGLRPHRPAKGSGNTMGGWYFPLMHYDPEQFGGLSATRFCEAVRAEGCIWANPGANKPLHLHPLFNSLDVYGHGKPTRIANSARDLRQPEGSLPVTEKCGTRLVQMPWFKHCKADIIKEYAGAYRKAAENYRELLADDPGDGQVGRWSSSRI